MLSHIAKLIWNRKKANALIMSEVIITFMVIFALFATLFYNFKMYNEPLGFKWNNTWAVKISTGSQWNQEKDKVALKTMVETLSQLPNVKSVTPLMMPVFEYGRWNTGEDILGETRQYQVNYIDKEGTENLGLSLINGRWFDESDIASDVRNVIVNKAWVDQIIPDQDPIGFTWSDPETGKSTKRIIGVFDEFKQQGHFVESGPYMFYRYDYTEGNRYGMHNLYIVFDRKVSADYQQQVMSTLKRISPSWDFTINTLKDLRGRQINEVAVPLMIGATVVLFLLIMVAMGLFGVLWQNINKRTKEIGLRRAFGATNGAIKSQIIGEMCFLTIVSVIIASVLLIQLPLLSLVEQLTWGNFWLSLLASGGVILLLVTLCALYPSQTAVKMPIANALHYE